MIVGRGRLGRMSAGPLIVQSDKTLLLEVEHPLSADARVAIAPFAELERAPEHVHTYRITPLALWNARAAGHDAEQVVDGESFQNFLNECVMGSLEGAQRVGQMAVTYLSDVQEPGAWWGELLAYEQVFFLQAATAEAEPAADIPRRGRSAACRA